jgi:hypothetical protein
MSKFEDDRSDIYTPTENAHDNDSHDANRYERSDIYTPTVAQADDRHANRFDRSDIYTPTIAQADDRFENRYDRSDIYTPDDEDPTAHDGHGPGLGVVAVTAGLAISPPPRLPNGQVINAKNTLDLHDAALHEGPAVQQYPLQGLPENHNNAAAELQYPNPSIDPPHPALPPIQTIRPLPPPSFPPPPPPQQQHQYVTTTSVSASGSAPAEPPRRNKTVIIVGITVSVIVLLVIVAAVLSSSSGGSADNDSGSQYQNQPSTQLRPALAPYYSPTYYSPSSYYSPSYTATTTAIPSILENLTPDDDVYLAITAPTYVDTADDYFAPPATVPTR